jgi:hypothetical protein
MLKAKLMLVVGPGGARMDFVAGWLSLLPNFVNMNWGVDPVTGRSYGDMRFAKMLDHDQSFDDVWPGQFRLSTDTDLYITGTGHGYNLDELQDKIDAGLIKVLTITCKDPTTNFKKIAWDFFVKTHLSQDKCFYYRAIKSSWAIDRLLVDQINQPTDQDRIRVADVILKNIKVSNLLNNTQHPDSTAIEYNLLFQPGGSQYLCNCLGIKVDYAYHQYWDCVLPFSDSPHELSVWGHTWRYKDYFTD